MGGTLDPSGAEPVALSGAERSRKSEENSHLQRDAAASFKMLCCASLTLCCAKSVRCAPCRRIRTILVHSQTLKKKALQACRENRNNLRMCLHVIFFGAIR